MNKKKTNSSFEEKTKEEVLKEMMENLKKAYEVCAELDKHSVVTREVLDTQFTI